MNHFRTLLLLLTVIAIYAVLSAVREADVATAQADCRQQLTIELTIPEPQARAMCAGVTKWREDK